MENPLKEMALSHPQGCALLIGIGINTLYTAHSFIKNKTPAPHFTSVLRHENFIPFENKLILERFTVYYEKIILMHSENYTDSNIIWYFMM